MMPSPRIKPEVILTATLGLCSEGRGSWVYGQGLQGTTGVGLYSRGKKEVIQIGSNIGHWRTRGKEDKAGLKITSKGWSKADATRL